MRHTYICIHLLTHSPHDPLMLYLHAHMQIFWLAGSCRWLSVSLCKISTRLKSRSTEITSIGLVKRFLSSKVFFNLFIQLVVAAVGVSDQAGMMICNWKKHEPNHPGDNTNHAGLETKRQEVEKTGLEWAAGMWMWEWETRGQPGNKETTAGTRNGRRT